MMADTTAKHLTRPSETTFRLRLADPSETARIDQRPQDIAAAERPTQVLSTLELAPRALDFNAPAHPNAPVAATRPLSETPGEMPQVPNGGGDGGLLALQTMLKKRNDLRAAPRSPSVPAAPIEVTPAAPPPPPRGALTLDRDLATLLPRAEAIRWRCFPFLRQGGWLWIATDLPARDQVARAVAQCTRLSIVVGEAPTSVVEAVLHSLYGSALERTLHLVIEPIDTETQQAVALYQPPSWAGVDGSHTVRDQVGDIVAALRLIEAEADAALKAEEEEVTSDATSHTSRLVNSLLALALHAGASDVHFEPDENVVHVRMRVDGVLQPLMQLPAPVLSRVVGRLKVLASMNLVEKRLPQEARFRYLQQGDRRVDIRLSTMPVVWGEGMVLRLLDTDNLRLRVEELGLGGDDLHRVRRCLRGPRGLVLATGPTGSGKSTTLYTLVTELNDRTRKIVTVEDPVEYHLGGLQQVQVQANIGLTFERVVRSTLRQDPDVILIGEIRDVETAQAAVKAALTGHLVLSSLHTSDAASAVARLVDLGVEPAMCAAALRLVIGQRLLRTLCANCHRPVRANQVRELLELAGIDPTVAEMSMEAVGCEECRGIGYHGRRAIFEVMDLNSPRLRRLVQGGASAEALQAGAVEEGMTTLSDCALQLVHCGETSVEEALRVVWLD